jgi:thiopurine S-methyltransferase
MDWEKTWGHFGEKVPWQLQDPHPSLVRNIEVLTADKERQRILIPLCGMTYDMIWLADQGHTVVGVESVKAPIKAFFEKNQLEYDVDAINMAPSGAYIYKAKTKDITIVQCDFWSFRKAAVGGLAFDAVWDRAALIAMMGRGLDTDMSTGKKYLKVLRDVLAPGGRIMIETMLYDPDEKKDEDGPALCKDETLKAICGEEWTMERVELIPLKLSEYFQNISLKYKIEMSIHLLTPK